MNLFKKQNLTEFKIFFTKTLLPIHIMVILDFSLTLLGQEESFWKSFENLNEANPFIHFLIESLGLLGIILSILTWIVGYSLIIFYLPKAFAKFSGIKASYYTAFAILCFWTGHLFGFVSWLGVIFKDSVSSYNYWFMIIFSIIALNILLMFIYRKLNILKFAKIENQDILVLDF